MAYKQVYMFTIFLVFLCYLQKGYGLKCYVCNSNTNAQCADNNPEKIPDTLIEDCPSKTSDGVAYSLCRKIKQTIEFEVNGLPANTRIIRSCGWDDTSYKNKCYQRSGYGGRQEVCSCEGDNCNSSTNLKAFSFVSLVTVFLSLKMFL